MQITDMLTGMNISTGITTVTSADPITSDNAEVIKVFFPVGFSITTKRIMLGNVPIILYKDADDNYAIGVVVEVDTQSGTTMYGSTRTALSVNNSWMISEDADKTITGTLVWHGYRIAVNAGGAIAMVDSGVATTTTTITRMGDKNIRVIKNVTDGTFFLSVANV